MGRPVCETSQSGQALGRKNVRGSGSPHRETLEVEAAGGRPQKPAEKRLRQGNDRRPERRPARCERTCGRKSSAPPVKRPAAGKGQSAAEDLRVEKPRAFAAGPSFLFTAFPCLRRLFRPSGDGHALCAHEGAQAVFCLPILSASPCRRRVRLTCRGAGLFPAFWAAGRRLHIQGAREYKKRVADGA